MDLAVPPSSLYPLLDRFFVDNGLNNTLKAFRKEVGNLPASQSDVNFDLVQIYDHYLKTGSLNKKRPRTDDQANGHGTPKKAKSTQESPKIEQKEKESKIVKDEDSQKKSTTSPQKKATSDDDSKKKKNIEKKNREKNIKGR